MATIDNLKPSILELTEDELKRMISERRLSRRIMKASTKKRKKKGVTKAPKKEKTATELVGKMSKEKKLSLLEKLEDI